MANRWRLRVRASLAWAWVALAFGGCANRADREFRSAVAPVLERAAQMSNRIDLAAPSDHWRPSLDGWQAPRAIEADGQKALAEVHSFRGIVRKLPEPRERGLRLLRISLDSLGARAEALVSAGVMARLSMFPVEPDDSYMSHLKRVGWTTRREGVFAERYVDALLDAAATEQVVRGSAILRTKAKWYDPFGPLPYDRPRPDNWPDSLVTERASIVKMALAAGVDLRP